MTHNNPRSNFIKKSCFTLAVLLCFITKAYSQINSGTVIAKFPYINSKKDAAVTIVFTGIGCVKTYHYLTEVCDWTESKKGKHTVKMKYKLKIPFWVNKRRIRFCFDRSCPGVNAHSGNIDIYKKIYSKNMCVTLSTLKRSHNPLTFHKGVWGC